MDTLILLIIIAVIVVILYFLLKLFLKALKVAAVLLIIIFVLGILGYVNTPQWIRTGASYGWKGIKATGHAVKWLFGNREKIENTINETQETVSKTKENVEVIVKDFKE